MKDSLKTGCLMEKESLQIKKVDCKKSGLKESIQFSWKNEQLIIWNINYEILIFA